MSAGGRTTIDYTEAERRYVVEGKSVRQISKEMGLKSWSSMNAIAKRDDWPGKRSAYLSAIARRSYETSAAQVANDQNAIRDEAVLAARASIRQYLADLAAGKVTVNARDAHLWASFLMAEITAPAMMNSEVPDVRNVTPPDHDLLRRVVEAARERVAPAGGVGPTALVIAPDARPN